MNYISAFLFYPIFFLTVNYLFAGVINPTYGHKLLAKFTEYLFIYSLSFCIFNLLPFYPLDGFRMADALNKKRGKVYWFLRRYGYYILLGLILLSFVSQRLAFRVPFFGYLDILGYVMWFARSILGWPIEAFWQLIINLIVK